MVHASISMSDLRVDSAGDIRIFVRFWRPPGRVRGLVTIVPGFNAHSGYYAWTAEQLTERGLAVYADIGTWIDAHLSAVAETKARTQ